MITTERETKDKFIILKSISQFILCLGLCLGIGFLSALATQSSVNGWYLTLNKPSFNPPNWIFAPVWTTLYVMMGIALFLVWQKNGPKFLIRLASTFFFIQLFLNALWSVAFFAMKSPLLGLIDISALILTLMATVFFFFRVSRAAGLLLLPYLAWVGFAAILNYTIWLLN